MQLSNRASVPCAAGAAPAFCTSACSALANRQGVARPNNTAPPPKVASAVVHLAALPAPRYPADAAILNRVVAAAFNQRRKMLRAALKGLAPDIEERLASVGIAPTERAERVPLDRFCALARTFGGSV